MSTVKVVRPTQCVLWQQDTPELHILRNLKFVTNYISDSHFKRSLLQCPECGQYYYFEFYETIDWEHGNDPQYKTYIPIEVSDETIEELNQLDKYDIQGSTPKIIDDWKADDTRTIKWVGRD